MELHVVSDAHETSWLHEDQERAKFRRLTEEQGAAQAMHMAVVELVGSHALTTDAIRGILQRLEAMGYTVRRKDNI